MFAVEHYGIEPDIICMAKGIASGFPFSALGTAASSMASWPTGSHGGTYGGNAIGCAAALATIEVLTRPASSTTSAPAASSCTPAARAAAARRGIVEVRGLGLMVGTEFDRRRPGRRDRRSTAWTRAS